MPWTTPVTDSELVAIHAALLPTEPGGVVVYFGDWTGGQGGVGVQDLTHTRLHRIQANQVVEPPGTLPDTDVFCAGHAFLSDGRLLAAGGTFGWAQGHEGIHLPHYDGEKACWVYLPQAQSWAPMADLNFQPGSDPQGGGRWYPTLVTLENGEVFAAGGHPAADDFYPAAGTQRHNNNTPERYSPSSGAWALMTSDITAPNNVNTDSYPRFHVLPDGRLFSDTAGKDTGDGAVTARRIMNPYSGEWEGPNVSGLGTLPGFYDRGSEATSVLLPLLPPHYPARILATNSGTPTAYRIDVDDTPSWQETTARQGSAAGRRRDNASATLLPTGQVLVTGGWPGNAQADDVDDATLEPELYTPGIDWANRDFSDTGAEAWETIAEPAPSRRGYHSTALLLPDGRVWVGGSTTTAEPLNREIDVFEPDYVGTSNRPVITSVPSNISYSMAFTVDTPQAGDIARVALIRTGSITHGFNSDQRYVGLEFSVTNSNTLSVASPPNGRVAPPGYYMLWLIDDQGRPCERATFVRVSRQKLTISADISTFSRFEVEALGTPAHFSSVLHVAADGFLPSEVSTPTFQLLYTNNQNVPDVTIGVGAPKYEAGPQHTDIAQRIVYPVHLTFTSTDAFDDIPANKDTRTMVFYAQMGLFVGFVHLQLSKNPNPRMSDGDPPWLSIDLRVFKTNPGDTFTAGVEHPAGAAGAYQYIQDVISAHNNWGGGSHPFDDLPTDQDVNRLELASQDVNGEPVFNYALARVRFRAPVDVKAVGVKVFFRMWTTGWTALEFDTAGSYRTHGNGASATPLLGIRGGELNNVPCFAQERRVDMTKQSDSHNRRTLPGADDVEVHGYFGCWLDVNQDVKRFPLEPTGDGPFGGDLKSIKELMRGLHQCLVAEIHYELDPTPAGSTPGSSDNLAQRNILFDDSDNPGGFAAHLVHHTFELAPSPFSFEFEEAALAGDLPTAAASARLHLDELAVDWGDLPRDSLVSFYMPQVDAREIVAAGGRRQAPPNLRSSGSDTVMAKVTDIGFLPIPGPLDKTIAGLLSVQLPPGVSTGKTYTVVLRQISGRMPHRVLGTTEFRIRVGKAAELLPKALHNLSVLRHVAEAIPPTNRWFPVFDRYLAELADRVRAFGGDPDEAVPSPTGHPQGAEGRPAGRREDVACFTGRVRRLLYNCFGQFEGFVLYDCDRDVRFPSPEEGIERVILQACHHGLAVAVFFDAETLDVRRLSLECGSWDPCPPPAEPEPRATVAQNFTPSRATPDPKAQAAAVKRRLQRGPGGPIDPGHGGHGHEPARG